MAHIKTIGKGLTFIFGVIFLLGLSTPPKLEQQPLNGIDLKTPQKISGASLNIERFVGTLILKTSEDFNSLTLSASGNDNELKELTVLPTGEGEVNVTRASDASNTDGASLVLTITMPKQIPLTLHINSGKATLENHEGAVRLSIDGNASITTGTIGGDLRADINGDGDITIANIDSTTRTTPLSPIKFTIQGNGKIKLDAFNYEDIDATINGAGLIKLNGILHNGDFTINGTGKIEIAKVLGEVSQKINGSGVVIVHSK